MATSNPSCLVSVQLLSASCFSPRYHPVSFPLHLLSSSFSSFPPSLFPSPSTSVSFSSFLPSLLVSFPLPPPSPPPLLSLSGLFLSRSLAVCLLIDSLSAAHQVFSCLSTLSSCLSVHSHLITHTHIILYTHTHTHTNTLTQHEFGEF